MQTTGSVANNPASAILNSVQVGAAVAVEVTAGADGSGSNLTKEILDEDWICDTDV